jgi:polyhydroxyalkanoate synthesis regulator phasin
MADLQKLEQKIGEALGLEKAAQVAEELAAKGLLDQGGMKDKLQTMKKQANNHQANLEELIPALEAEGLSSENIRNTATETEQKAAEMMDISRRGSR